MHAAERRGYSEHLNLHGEVQWGGVLWPSRVSPQEYFLRARCKLSPGYIIFEISVEMLMSASAESRPIHMKIIHRVHYPV